MNDATGTLKNKDTILVVGRFGSGKSTFLNTLAGVCWTFRNGEFAVNERAEEIFPSGRSVKGCTTVAVSRSFDSFDGQRRLTVIDTVGYDDSVNAESFYNTSNLTEVMNQHDGISALVIVMNYSDPRLTQGFVESLVCVPKSFKKRVQQNVVLVFTNCSEEALEEGDAQYGDKLFAQPVKVIRKALGFKDCDEHITVPIFCMDNRPFKKCSDNTRHTISHLQAFLDCVTTMPELSCETFKEMRALSQFERAMRKAIDEYFQPSNRSVTETGRSGFENFLFKCSQEVSEKLPKITLTSFTAADWAKKLYEALQEEVIGKLPGEFQKICEEVDLNMAGNQFHKALPDGRTVLDRISEVLVFGGASACIGTAAFSAGLSLVALPACAAIAYAHSKTWSRQSVIDKVVFDISERHGKDLRGKCAGQFTDHVDNMVKGLQECFEA